MVWSNYMYLFLLCPYISLIRVAHYDTDRLAESNSIREVEMQSK